MNCDEYRRALLGEPGTVNADMQEHRRGCLDCARFTRQAEAFEARLRAALEIPVQTTSDIGPASSARPRWLALAASVLIGLGLASALWLSSATSSLARAVVEHLGHEPNAWAVTGERVDAARLAAILRASNLRLKAPLSQVSYAQSCEFRGHPVPHLVLQSGRGPITVMVLGQEKISAAQSFDEHGYRGLMIPVAGHGGLAVLQRDGDSEEVMRQAGERVAGAIEWLTH